MKTTRRAFIQCGSCGLTAAVLGAFKFPLLGPETAAAQVPPNLNINLSMEEADVEMVDGTIVFHWLFQVQGNALPSVSGPVIFAFTGDVVTLNITNNLDEIHEFRILAAGPLGADLNTGPIAPGQTVVLTFTAPAGGTYMYLDPRNAPVNRVLGLHGVFIALPAAARALPGPGLRYPAPAPTPYSTPTAMVQRLFNHMATPLFNVRPSEPAQSWVPVRPPTEPIPHPFMMAFEDNVLAADTLTQLAILERFLFRTRIWVFNGIDPQFNAIAAAGGNAEPGGGIDPGAFQANFLARYFHISGKTGEFASTSHVAPEITLSAFVGQPHVVRIVNAGVNDFSPHLHANHFYVLAVNNVPMANVVQPDSMTVTTLERDIPRAQLPANRLAASQTLALEGGSRVDWLVPFQRPQDIPGDRDILLQDLIPEELAVVLDGVPQSPLMYPMHSHVELDQTAAGGNYPQGLITHFEFLGELINGQEVLFPHG